MKLHGAPSKDPNDLFKLTQLILCIFLVIILLINIPAINLAKGFIAFCATRIIYMYPHHIKKHTEMCERKANIRYYDLNSINNFNGI